MAAGVVGAVVMILYWYLVARKLTSLSLVLLPFLIVATICLVYELTLKSQPVVDFVKYTSLASGGFILTLRAVTLKKSGAQ